MVDARIDALDKLKGLFKAQDNGRYFVRRGVIDWSSFPFTDHPWAVAIQIDQGTIETETGFQQYTIGVEMFTQIPGLEVQEDIEAKMIQDVRIILQKWKTLKNERGDNIICKVYPHIVFQEVYDIDLNVQGMTFQLDVEF